MLPDAPSPRRDTGAVCVPPCQPRRARDAAKSWGRPQRSRMNRNESRRGGCGSPRGAGGRGIAALWWERGAARGLQLSLCRLREPPSWGFLKNAERGGTRDEMQNWQRSLHCAPRAELRNELRSSLPSPSPAALRLPSPRAVCAAEAVFFWHPGFRAQSIGASNSINDYLLVLNAK